MPTGLFGPLAGSALAVLGALTALPAVVLHQWWSALLVGLVAPALFLAALRPGWQRAGYAVGWAVVVGLLSGTRSEGDYLVPSTVNGYALLVATAAFVVVALVTVPAHGRGDRASTGRDDPGNMGPGT